MVRFAILLGTVPQNYIICDGIGRPGLLGHMAGSNSFITQICGYNP